VIAAALAAGCSHGVKEVTPCGQARADAAKHAVHGVLRGDVDGDGTPDRVGLVRLRRNSRCGAVLVVRTRRRTLTRSFETSDADPGVPTLNGLAALTARPALHIVLTLQEGASTGFASVFAIRRGRISKLSIPGSEGFAYWGSVTHYGGVDCVRGRPGLIEERGFTTLGSNRLRLYRTYYRVRDTGFELVRREVLKKVPRSLLLGSGGADPLFPSCMRVRAAS
jgi:hypothetical protein